MSPYARYVKKIKVQLKRHPKSARLQTILGRLYQQMGQYAQARQAYRQALKWQPGYSHALVGMAHLALKRRALRQAARLLSQVLKKQPRHAPALAKQSELWRLRALQLRDKKRQTKLFQRAVRVLQRAILYKPKAHRYRYRLAILYLGLRRYLQANAQFAAALSMRSFQPCYKLGLAVSEALLMRSRRSLFSDLKRGIEQCGHPLLEKIAQNMLVVLAMQRAQRWIAQRKRQRAIKLLKEAVRLAPQVHKTYFFLALLQYQESQCKAARSTLQALLRRAPSHAAARRLLRRSLRCRPLPSRRILRKTNKTQRARVRRVRVRVIQRKKRPNRPRHAPHAPKRD